MFVSRDITINEGILCKDVLTSAGNTKQKLILQFEVEALRDDLSAGTNQTDGSTGESSSETTTSDA